MNIILIGTQGSGKGTQAELLTQDFGIRHVATGDLFRQALEEKTAFGLQAKEYIERGELVPDEITVAMVRTAIEEPESAQGIVLDGFPRTLAQAQALDNELQSIGRQIDAVVYLNVTHEELMSRLVGRYICRDHQHLYHIKFRPPKVAGICDQDGSELYQRSDDTGEAIERRLGIFFQETTHVLDYYKEQRKLLELDADPSVKTVHTALLSQLNSYIEQKKQG
ncbi:MAG: adenylate kinase [Ktedonobacteraceae bacterium]